MPHIILEHSSNLIKKDKFSDLFSDIHDLLRKKLPTDIFNCKSRAISHDDFYIGNGNKEDSFIYLNIKILSGRSSELIDEISNNLSKLLKKYFIDNLGNKNLSISIDISEMTHYNKHLYI
jgi:5-carboxymethyl-2-hydroxymuconate isomerase